MKKKAADPPTVLVVEDTEDNRFMMRRLLEMAGYRVVEAMNGEEAVRVARTESPQLILMDLSLPVIDGLAATRLIRKVPALEATPIIAVSAHDTSDFQAEAVDAGCNSYVTKPIDFNRAGAVDSAVVDARRLLEAQFPHYGCSGSPY